MGSNFALLEKHLESDLRRRQLLEIEGRLKEHAYPPQVVLENTSICNLTCIHCSHRELQRTRRHMKRPLWNKIVEELGANAPYTEIWPTFYGEALIMGYKGELWDRLDYADKVGCRNLVLNSNGTLLDRWDNIDKILASPLRRFILSLDGLSKETFELIREKAKWEEVYPQVEELCRRRCARGQKYPAITAQFSVMKQNAHEVDAYRAYLGSARRRGEDAADAGVDGDRHGAHRHDRARHRIPHRLPVGQQHDGDPPGRLGGGLRRRLRGQVQGRQLNEITVKEAWARLGERLRRPHREHRWKDIPDICKGCGDWQVAGAEYEEETVEGTRPFWYYDQEKRAQPADVGAERQAMNHESPPRSTTGGAVRTAARGIGISDDARAVVRLSLQRALPALPLYELQHPQGVPRRALHAGGAVQEDRRRIGPLRRLPAHLRAAASRCCIRRPTSCSFTPRRSAARSA